MTTINSVKIYLVVRFNHEGAPDWNSEDTIYFVRAKHHLAAVEMVEDELSRQPNIMCRPYVNIVYLVGQTKSKEAGLLTDKPLVAFGRNYGFEKRWVRQFPPDEPWIVYDHLDPSST